MPGGRGKIRPEDNTNGFQKNPQNINRSGANRKLVSSVNKELENMGVKETTAAEIKSIYLRLVNLQIGELEKMVKEKDQPSLVRIIAKNILSDKGFEIIEKMFDRAISRPSQKIDHTTKGKEIENKTLINYSGLSDETLKDLEKNTNNKDD